MKKTFLYLLFFGSLFISNAQDVKLSKMKNNKANVEFFLNMLTKSTSSNIDLYNNYFFINEKGKPNRDEEGVRFYTDTLLIEIKGLLMKNSFSVYPLSVARTKFKRDNLYNYYYDGQKELIYIILIKTKDGNNFYYALMYEGKIVSLMPDKILDNEIISWI